MSLWTVLFSWEATLMKIKCLPSKGFKKEYEAVKKKIVSFDGKFLEYMAMRKLRTSE